MRAVWKDTWSMRISCFFGLHDWVRTKWSNSPWDYVCLGCSKVAVGDSLESASVMSRAMAQEIRDEETIAS